MGRHRAFMLSRSFLIVHFLPLAIFGVSSSSAVTAPSPSAAAEAATSAFVPASKRDSRGGYTTSVPRNHQSASFLALPVNDHVNTPFLVLSLAATKKSNGGNEGENVQRPRPRRTLKKRPGRSRRRRDIVGGRGGGDGSSGTTKGDMDDFPWETAESRPLVTSRSIEAGQDYWIDESELKKSLELEQAIKNRKAMEGEIPKEKLQKEVVAPYKQNWIGLLSAAIIVLAAIIKTSPDLINAPVIQIPDL